MLGLVIAMLFTSPAFSAAPAPSLAVHVVPLPTIFSATNNARCAAEREEEKVVACDFYDITVTNTGAMKTNGSTITIRDTLPAGLVASGAVLLRIEPQGRIEQREPSACTLTPPTCKFHAETSRGSLLTGTLKPGDSIEMQLYVTVEPGATGTVTNHVTVTGGEAPEAVADTPSRLGEDETVPFGANPTTETLQPDGTTDAQAGSHPYAFLTHFDLNSEIRASPESQIIATSSEDLKDVFVDLPVGFTGSVAGIPTCTFGQLASLAGCPADSQVGTIYSAPQGIASIDSAVYNMLPERGVAAEFGFQDVLDNTHAIYAQVVPTPEGYALQASTRDVPQIALTQAVVTFFGDPATHDGASRAPSAMFTNPTECSGAALTTTAYTDSWQTPGRVLADGTPDLGEPAWHTSTSETPAVTGCSALEGLFAPSLTAAVSNSQSDSPTGLDLNIKVPQHESPEELGTPPLKEAVVALPAGISVNASSVNGLEACSLAQVGMSSVGQPNSALPSCPEASKIGTVELETPALPDEACREPTKNLAECPAESEREKTPLRGAIYVAKQSENPFGSLLAIYIVIDDPRTGVLVKLPAEVKADASTGQLTTVVRNSPQFPFSELRTHFFSGNTAALATPSQCGTYSVTSQLTPWSAPESGPPATPEAGLTISERAGGGVCGSVFTPTFAAGTETTKAGAYAPLQVAFSRSDADQQLSGLSATMPPGVLGSIKHITQCPEPQAAQGNCPPESLIGESDVAVGTGPAPYWVHGGKVYLTGPYNNGPFGLTIVTPTTAGPYTLTGNGGPGREIVRASIRVDPSTGQITVLSDPLPTILEGIPLEIRTVHVTIDRPGFTFNATNCTPLQATATITSTQGAAAAATSPYQARECTKLPFHPTLTASSEGKASRVDGASLKVKVTSSAGQANIARTFLTLPKLLPSRLDTIKKACPDTTFQADPASCDEGSMIGTATVRTPLLKSQLTGPAYLVSHGGAAFPDVEFVLQGEGVTLILDGRTDIKNGITYSRFETVPDAPIETFEAILPTGPHSALGTYEHAANGTFKSGGTYSLCGSKLQMPTVIIAQNGAEVKQTTPIAVAGCPKALTAKQKLDKALKTCRKQRSKKKRVACERAARKRYPTPSKKRHVHSRRPTKSLRSPVLQRIVAFWRTQPIRRLLQT